MRQGFVARFPDAVLEVGLDRVAELSEVRERLWVIVEGAGFLTLDEKPMGIGYLNSIEFLPARSCLTGRWCLVAGSAYWRIHLKFTQ